jgi:hypothetical protein
MQVKLRKRVLSAHAYVPQWEGFVLGFVVNFLRRNYWRVQSYMEYEDCLQEAWLKFNQVKVKYGNLDTPQHFMTIYKLAWTNKFNELAVWSGKHRAEVCVSQLETDDAEDTGALGLLAGDFNNDGMLAIMIDQAPHEVKHVLHLFLTAPVEVLDMFAETWKSRGRHKPYGNAHLCELLGLPEKTDVVGMVTAYFAE